MTERREFRQYRFAPPPGATEILLVRHGESAPFVDGEAFPMLDGQGDPPLHPDGERQAQLVADRLVSTGERIAAVYVSSLQRTHQTAAPLLSVLGLRPVVVPELREVFLGEWEGGVYRRRLADGDPIARRLFTEQRWDVIPGAETAEQFEGRVRSGIGQIVLAHPDQLVVAVVHGGVIGQVMKAATGAVGFAFNGADNASISHLVVHEDRWMVRCFNDTSHLRARFSTAPEPLI